MHYTVVWVRSASNRLAEIWMQAPDRGAVRRAADEIDRLLRTSPLSVGVPLGAARRLTVKPLEVLYLVSVPDRMVRVFQVRYVP